MPLQPVAVESFSGLNLIDDPGTVGWGEALDLLNVDLDQRGRVRSRDGYSNFLASAATDRSSSLHGALSATGYFLLAGQDTTMRAYNSAASSVATSTPVGFSGSASFADIGTSSGSFTYFTVTASTQVQRFDPTGPSFSAPAGLATIAGLSIGVTPWDNRLVVAVNDDRLRFSDPGAPETMGANNYIDLHPGDGQSIQGIVSYRDLLLVFKETKFFVFYGTSTDGQGNPIFNYRTVDAGIGAVQRQNAHGFAAGPEGVYFFSNDGIYRTSGGEPVKISRNIDPCFVGTLPALFVGTGGTAISLSRMGYWNRRLYVSGSAGGTYYTFVYDVLGDYWLFTDLPSYSFAPFGASRNALSLHIGQRTPNQIIKLTTGTTDAGTAITSRYRSGFSDLGSPDMKRIHSWRLQGTGSPTLKLSTDFGSLETGAAVTLGTSPAVAEGVRRYAPRGRQFSWQLSGTSAWSVNSLVAQVAGKRRTGEHVSA